jgi:hypothetical protein
MKVSSNQVGIESNLKSTVSNQVAAETAKTEAFANKGGNVATLGGEVKVTVAGLQDLTALAGANESILGSNATTKMDPKTDKSDALQG